MSEEVTACRFFRRTGPIVGYEGSGKKERSVRVSGRSVAGRSVAGRSMYEKASELRRIKDA